MRQSRSVALLFVIKGSSVGIKGFTAQFNELIYNLKRIGFAGIAIVGIPVIVPDFGTKGL